MNWTPFVDLYLFIVAGVGFAGSVVLMRFFSMRWDSPVMKAKTVLYTAIAAGLLAFMTSKLLTYFLKISMFELSPYAEGMFLTILSGAIWYVVWQVRVKMV